MHDDIRLGNEQHPSPVVNQSNSICSSISSTVRESIDEKPINYCYRVYVRLESLFNCLIGISAGQKLRIQVKL